MQALVNWKLMQVSSRAPVWGASPAPMIPRKSLVFQVVPPCGGHPSCACASRASLMFQVVPPCGGHRQRERLGNGGNMFQVVPPCGGHLGGRCCFWPVCIVSSRAPVWGASGVMTGSRLEMMLFQVVPPCGGHHAGKGAGSRQRQGFKSCPRVGGIGCVRDPVGVEAGFKSCPRVGGILSRLTTGGSRASFQVVPPCGGHLRAGHAIPAIIVSSRAPVWGASG